jgi:hypothetical protein
MKDWSCQEYFLSNRWENPADNQMKLIPLFLRASRLNRGTEHGYLMSEAA